MWSQCRNVRSFAKNVLGSIFIGVVRSRGLSAAMTRSNQVRSGGPLLACAGRAAAWPPGPQTTEIETLPQKSTGAEANQLAG